MVNSKVHAEVLKDFYGAFGYCIIFPKYLLGGGSEVIFGGCQKAVGWIQWKFQASSCPGILGCTAAKFWRLNFCCICNSDDGAVHV